MKAKSFLLVLVATLLSIFSSAQTYVIKGVSYPIPNAIDLGLPSGNLWADMNIGASLVTESGGYYGWADPTGELTKDDYVWYSESVNGKWESPLFGGTNPPKDISGTELDLATSKMGSEWCIPRESDFKELSDVCTFTVENDYVKVTGPNGKYIFMPKTGIYNYQHVIHYIEGKPNDECFYGESMTSLPCFWASTRTMYDKYEENYWAPYNFPAADYASVDERGIWGAEGTCNCCSRNAMIPIRAIKKMGKTRITKCPDPSITITNGEVVFSCDLDNVNYYYDIKHLDKGAAGMGNNIKLTSTYRISVYASKDGYENSDVTTKDIDISAGITNGDVNNDGVVNAADIVTIVNIIEGK